MVPVCGLRVGKLTSESEELVLAELSTQAGSWWELSPVPWHDNAVVRYFVTGPLNTTEMERVAAIGKEASRTTYSKSMIGSELLNALASTATAEYNMSPSIVGTGDIHISMWMLMFQTYQENGMVPMLVIKDQQHGSHGVSREGDQLWYATLWQYSRSLGAFINAVPAQVSHFPSSQWSDPTREPASDFDISVLVNTRVVPPCETLSPFDVTGPFLWRSLLDSAYGLIPATMAPTCWETPADVRLLVTTYYDAGDGESVSFSKSGWKRRPLQDCIHSDIRLLIFTSSDHVMCVCIHSFCVFVDSPSINVTCGGQQVDQDHALNIVLKAAKNQCIQSSNGSSFECDQKCDLTAYSSILSMKEALEGITNVLATRSNWALSKGENTMEFKYAPEEQSEYQLCYLQLEQLPVLSDDQNITSTVTNPSSAGVARAINYITAYVDEHSNAFTSRNGPGMDRATFYALLITTTVSVVTVAGSVTKFQLKMASKLHPSYLSSPTHVKTVLHVACNLLWGFLLFLPVLSVALNELARQKPFDTWSLVEQDLPIHELEYPMRVLFLLSATSRYHSQFFVVCVAIFCLTSLLVAVYTVKRCCKVFTRYRQISDAIKAQDRESSCALTSNHKYMAMKAIDIGEAEYLELGLLLHKQAMHAGPDA